MAVRPQHKPNGSKAQNKTPNPSKKPEPTPVVRPFYYPFETGFKAIYLDYKAWDQGRLTIFLKASFEDPDKEGSSVWFTVKGLSEEDLKSLEVGKEYFFYADLTRWFDQFSNRRSFLIHVVGYQAFGDI